MHNNTGSQLYSSMVKNCSYIGVFFFFLFATIFFLLSCIGPLKKKKKKKRKKIVLKLYKRSIAGNYTWDENMNSNKLCLNYMLKMT